MRGYVEKLQAMSNIDLAKEWSNVWYEHRRSGRTGGNGYAETVEKLNALRDVIVDRFVKQSFEADNSKD